MKMTISIDSDVKKRAESLSKSVRISMSEIIELLLQNVSESEILKMYNKKVK